MTDDNTVAVSSSSGDGEIDMDHYLYLSSKRIDFEGVSKSGLTSVFFDEVNSQVFSVLSGDTTQVTVNSFDARFCTKLSIPEKGRVLCIKFSPDQKILAVQRTLTSIEFLVIEGGCVVREFEEVFKGSTLLGFIWTSLLAVSDGSSLDPTVVFITKSQVKLCRIDSNLGFVSNIKSINISVNWYIHYAPINLLGLNTGPSGHSLQLLQIKSNAINKLPKFDVDVDIKSKKQINERDVLIGSLYNQPRILVLNYQAVNTGLSTEILVYTIDKLSLVKKTHVLRIHESGRFAMNILDNLVIVHNQANKTSCIFDITNGKFAGSVSYYSPVVAPKSIRPYEDPTKYSLYSQNWITFHPNIIMDIKIGCLWSLELNLHGFYSNVEETNELVKFLLLRYGSNHMIGKVIAKVAASSSRLEELGSIFDQINSIYRCYLEQVLKRQDWVAEDWKTEDEDVLEFQAVLDQNFIYDNVFYPFVDKLSSRQLSWMLLEYIRSLSDFSIPAEYFIHKLLINCLVQTKRFYQLHQLLQYYAVVDSKPLACLLLSLENLYPASSQLAVDMLDRLGTAKEEITEILLSQGQVLSALRYATSHAHAHDIIRPAKYIEAAKSLHDPVLQKSLEIYFEHNSRNTLFGNYSANRK